MSIHDGHRQRLKKRFLEEGLDNFTDIQVLELLLFYCIPRQDTNPIAHKLLDHFGGLSQVLEATPAQLQKVPGIGENTATFLRLVTEVERYYLVDRSTREKVLNGTEDCARYLIPFFFGRAVETVFLLCMDAKGKVLCCKEMGEGSVNSAGISVRKIMETALGANASMVALAHNHPSGIAVPSHEDIITTRRVVAALNTVDIKLLDHLVIADGDYVSIRQSGYRIEEDYYG